MTDREKLLHLIGQVQDEGRDYSEVTDPIAVPNEVLADHLIANGVTVRRSGHWEKDVDCGCVMHRCSLCGARVVRGEYEYENPNLYCYHCGAKMEE